MGEKWESGREGDMEGEIEVERVESWGKGEERSRVGRGGGGDEWTKWLMARGRAVNIEKTEVDGNTKGIGATI